MAFIRFCDRTDLNITGRADFHLRPRGQQIYTLFVITVLTIGGVAGVLYYYGLYNGTARARLENEAAHTSLFLVIVGVLMYYTSKRFSRLRHELLATEFMAAMFASALAINCKFAMVVKPDGTIVYFDRAFQQMFPELIELPTHRLEVLCDMYVLDPTNRRRILSSVATSQKEVLSILIAGGKDKTPCSIQLFLEPIPRPSGFILLRGRAG